ncbi:MAG: TrkH family potassium uptake protein [Rhodospirillales bacterium]|nr:TrkH family potassium uptake protein [Rhodospirillales bacterium]
MSVNNNIDSTLDFFQPIMLIIGILLIGLAVSMCVPAFVDIATGTPDTWVFPISAAATFVIGGGMALSTKSSHFKMSKRQTFAMATLIWVVITLFGSLPFVLGELHMNFTDAFFESMSGITTTGSTVITGLDGLSAGILVWRAILQWLGGLGIIVMSISILPLLRVGGMQIFNIEAFETGNKVFPRMAHISAGVTFIFVSLTLVCAFALWLAGMTGLEAITHAMTTIATGGYSTSDGSVGHFDSALIEAIITVGMIVGGIPFMLILVSLHGQVSKLLKDSQVHWYLGILLFSMIAVAGWLFSSQGMEPLKAVRYSTFTVASIMTGTGYASTDYSLWGMFPVVALFFLTLVGGCSGSTACGIKVFRFQTLFSIVRAEFQKIVQPHGVFIPSYNHNPISDEVISSILGFFAIFIFCFMALTVALGMLGLDFVTAISSAATAMSNVGPGFGPIVGPSGSFQNIPDAAKWLLSFGMLTGRLEVFTVMVLFTRHFWRN